MLLDPVQSAVTYLMNILIFEKKILFGHVTHEYFIETHFVFLCKISVSIVFWLTHWSRDSMATILQTFSNAISWNTMFVF